MIHIDSRPFTRPNQSILTVQSYKPQAKEDADSHIANVSQDEADGTKQIRQSHRKEQETGGKRKQFQVVTLNLHLKQRR